MFTEEERQTADVDAFEGRHFPYHPSVRKYKTAAAQGYPFLMKSAPALAAKGVAFTDLTQLFSSVRETVYRDACCHFNVKGYELVAEAIARDVAKRSDL